MNVDIDRGRFDVQIEDVAWLVITVQQVAIRLAYRMSHHFVAHEPPVDEEKLRVSTRACFARRPRESGDLHTKGRLSYRPRGCQERGACEGFNAFSPFAFPQMQADLAVMPQNQCDIVSH